MIRSTCVPHQSAHGTERVLPIESRQRDEGVRRCAPRTGDIVPRRGRRDHERSVGNACRRALSQTEHIDATAMALCRLEQRRIGISGHNL